MARSGKRTFQFGDDKARRKKQEQHEDEFDDSLAREVYGPFDMGEVMRTLDGLISRTTNYTPHGNPPPYSIHAKLEISHPQDAHEKQADQLARAVMDGDTDQSQEILSKPVNEVSRKGEGDAMTTPPGFDQQLQSSKGQGQKLDEGTKSELEQHTGTDLSGVNVHTSSAADALSQSISAKAFAHGQDIYFKQGQYNPQSEQGKELIAHEVAHTVQQGDSVMGKIQRKVDDPQSKPGYTIVEPPLQSMLKKTVSLRESDNETAKEVSLIYEWEEIWVTWSGPGLYGWVYCTIGADSGYLQKGDLIAFDGQLLNVFNVTPTYFEGSINDLAENIHDALHHKTLGLFENPEVDKLQEIIPENLSDAQRAELAATYKKTYNEDFLDALYEATSPGIFGSGEALFDTMYRASPYQKSAKGVSILPADGNTVSIEANVTYTFNGPKPQQHDVMNRYGSVYKDWWVDPRVFTPRVLIWLVRDPDYDVHWDKKRDATEDTYTFDADEIGYYLL